MRRINLKKAGKNAGEEKFYGSCELFLNPLLKTYKFAATADHDVTPLEREARPKNFPRRRKAPICFVWSFILRRREWALAQWAWFGKGSPSGVCPSEREAWQ